MKKYLFDNFAFVYYMTLWLEVIYIMIVLFHFLDKLVPTRDLQYSQKYKEEKVCVWTSKDEPNLHRSLTLF